MLGTLLSMMLAADPLLAVAAVEETPDAPARALVQQMAATLEAKAVVLAPYLVTQRPGCKADPRCLVAAPDFAGMTYAVLVKHRTVAKDRVVVDLRLVEVRTQRVVDRVAFSAAAAQASATAVNATRRMLRRSGGLSPPPTPAPTPSRAD